jgi:hypothetical protein
VNPYVRERINRKLDTLGDERLYQVLDYVEFLESRYAEKAPTPVNVLQRFTEGVEDKLRAGGVAVSTISETMGLLNRAVGVLNGVAQSTMSVAGDALTAARTAVEQVGAPEAPSAAHRPPSATTSAAAAAPAPAPAPATTAAAAAGTPPAAAPHTSPSPHAPQTPRTDGT